jgi:hypothetical protein
VRASGDDFCVVVWGDAKAVLGVLRGDALLKNGDVRADDVMELGTQTTRPSEPLVQFLKSNDAVGEKRFFVANSDGTLLGVLDRDTAEREVEKWQAAQTSSAMEESST